MNKWEEKFPIGDVVYYIEKKGDLDWNIKWGIAKGHYIDSLSIQAVHLKDIRKIDGVPYKDFVPDEKRRKLPKGWTYNTKLYEITLMDSTETGVYATKYNITNKESLLKAYNEGIFIKAQDYDYTHIETDITKEGWKLVKRYYPYQPIPSGYESRPYYECFMEYEEAKKYVQAHKDEIIRQCSLTDYEWSLEKIDHTLDWAMKLNIITEKEAKSIREQLLKEDVKNIDIRVGQSTVQWKLCKNKKWMTIKP